MSFHPATDTVLLCACGNALRSGNTMSTEVFAQCFNCNLICTRDEANALVADYGFIYEGQLVFASTFDYPGFDRASSRGGADYLPQNVLAYRIHGYSSERFWTIGTCTSCDETLIWRGPSLRWNEGGTWWHLQPSHTVRYCSTPDPHLVATYVGYTERDERLAFLPIGVRA